MSDLVTNPMVSSNLINIYIAWEPKQEEKAHHRSLSHPDWKEQFFSSTENLLQFLKTNQKNHMKEKLRTGEARWRSLFAKGRGDGWMARRKTTRWFCWQQLNWTALTFSLFVRIYQRAGGCVSQWYHLILFFTCWRKARTVFGNYNLGIISSDRRACLYCLAPILVEALK